MSLYMVELKACVSDDHIYMHSYNEPGYNKNIEHMRVIVQMNYYFNVATGKMEDSDVGKIVRQNGF